MKRRTISNGFTRLDLFNAKVNKTETCWLWAGSKNPKNYGNFYDGTKVVPAHRWSYEHFVGPIPAGLVIDHLCRVHDCVNPAHLEPVTQRVNVLRGTAPAATYAGQEVCARGHNDWRMRADGKGRMCRECQRITTSVMAPAARARRLSKLDRTPFDQTIVGTLWRERFSHAHRDRVIKVTAVIWDENDGASVRFDIIDGHGVGKRSKMRRSNFGRVFDRAHRTEAAA